MLGLVGWMWSVDWASVSWPDFNSHTYTHTHTNTHTHKHTNTHTFNKICITYLQVGAKVIIIVYILYPPLVSY